MNKDLLSISLVVLFSIFLWVFVSLSRDYPTDIDVPIEITQLPQNQTVGYISDTHVQLNLHGQGWQLTSLLFGSSNTYKVSANLKGGNHSILLRNRLQQNAWISNNLQVVDLQPLAIEFDVEEKDTIKVPIVVDLGLDFYPNYNLVSEIKLTPDSVNVVGPVSKLEKVTSIKTKYQEFSNLREKTTAVLDLIQKDGLEYLNTQCSVEFDVQKMVDISFDNINVQIRNLPNDKNLLLYPDQIRVSISGGINVLSQLTEEDIVAYVNFKEAENDTLGALIPVVELPANTHLLNFRPKKLNYIIKRF